MSATVGLPSSVVIRDLMLTLWFNRWRIFLITIGAMVIATYVALQVQPKYQSNSSMLVLLGPEYGSRPVAGQQLTGAINVLPQELLHTESDILASRDLHRSVIEQIGVAKLYPELVKPPGPVAQFFKQVRSYIKDFLGLAEEQQTTGTGGSAAVAAEGKFAQDLGVNVDRNSH
ncbi:MAG TPA: Wzz/FepE/Etk N-terminal domain-containing protein, partial [Acetobacteraceae bacterium]|nr:Wzz/FepE/Etk N-terminal domain-containing protein [Acetobacteraceae bacterium]